jgi:hypothetical protein
MKFKYLISILILVELSACTSYKRYQLSYVGVKEGNPQTARLYLVNNQDSSEVWHMARAKFSDHQIFCLLKKQPLPAAFRITTLEKHQNAADARNKVLFYAKPALVKRLPTNDTLTFDYHELDRIEAIEMNYKRTQALTIKFLVIALPLLAIWAIMNGFF